MLVLQNPLWHDAIAALITLALALLWLRIMDAIAHRGWLEPKLSRILAQGHCLYCAGRSLAAASAPAILPR
jgi:hypothetical protein